MYKGLPWHRVTIVPLKKVEINDSVHWIWEARMRIASGVEYIGQGWSKVAAFDKMYDTLAEQMSKAPKQLI